MFAYCGNNPVNNSDPTGELFIPTGDLLTDIGSALLLVGLINNTINAVYYEFSDGESDLTPDSYTQEGKKPTRWEKLDYTKQQTKEKHYNINAWRYHSEYSLHEYGWYVTSWAKDNGLKGVDRLIEKLEYADVLSDSWDSRWYVKAFTVLVGIIGI